MICWEKAKSYDLDGISLRGLISPMGNFRKIVRFMALEFREEI